MFKSAVLLVVLSFNCASGVTAIPKPRQTEAAVIVLKSFGGKVDPSRVPLIVWRETGLDCYPDARGVFTGWMDGAYCTQGFRWSAALLTGPEWIEVASPEGYPISAMAFTHELGHFYLAATEGNGDGNHTTAMFCDPDQVRPCAPDGGKVVVARKTLAEAGL